MKNLNSQEGRNVEIKTFVEDNWESYKRLRLASLKDAPDSFGSTLEREAAFSETEWRSRISSTKGPTNVLPLYAEIEGSLILSHTANGEKVE